MIKKKLTKAEKSERAAEKAYNRKLGGYKRRINSKLENDGLFATELLLEHFNKETVSLSKFGIKQADGIEIIKGCIEDYKEDLESIKITLRG